MSDLRIRELRELKEFEAALALFARIWGSGSEPINVEQMRALTHAGNYVAGAYKGGQLVAASAGFLSAPVGISMHSHVTGALPGHSAGHALKLHQREWARARGLQRITWTFDPLIRRNAHFNLTKLGGLPVEYLTNFYGSMHDEINGGDDTDRVLVAWDVDGPKPATPVVPAGTPFALADRDGRPLTGPQDAALSLIQIPADIEGLRRTDPGAAKAWRLALRAVLGEMLSRGARVTGFHDKSSYVIEGAP